MIKPNIFHQISLNQMVESDENQFSIAVRAAMGRLMNAEVMDEEEAREWFDRYY